MSYVLCPMSYVICPMWRVFVFLWNFPLVPMGVLPPGRQQICLTHLVCKVNLKQFLQPLRIHIRTLGQPLMEITRLSTQNLHRIGILIFLLVWSTCKIAEPYDNSFWEKRNPMRKKREEENFLLVPIVVLASGSAHAWPSAQPVEIFHARAWEGRLFLALFVYSKSPPPPPPQAK
jgi:hypothetical protein